METMFAGNEFFPHDWATLRPHDGNVVWHVLQMYRYDGLLLG